MLHRGADHDEGAHRTGHRSLDEEDVSGEVRLHDLEVQHGHALVAHLAGHPQAPEGPRRGRARAHGTGRAVLALGAVARGETAEPVTLHDAGVTLAHGCAGDIHDLAGEIQSLALANGAER